MFHHGTDFMPVSSDEDQLPQQSADSAKLFPRALALRGGIGAVAGAILGIIVSLLVNVALVEVSLSPFFALYFGLLFICVGALISWRVISGKGSNPDENHQIQLLVFSSLVVLSGFLCFFLGRDWFLQMSRVFKVPIYMLLGTSMAFALTFTIVDVLNILAGIFQYSAAKPLVQSVAQIRLVVGIAMLMGAIFGTVFGLLGVGQEISYHVRLALFREEHFCYPIGAVLGAIAGYGNEYIRYQSDSWQRLCQTDFDEDI